MPLPMLWIQTHHRPRRSCCWAFSTEPWHPNCSILVFRWRVKWWEKTHLLPVKVMLQCWLFWQLWYLPFLCEQMWNLLSVELMNCYLVWFLRNDLWLCGFWGSSKAAKRTVIGCIIKWPFSLDHCTFLRVPVKRLHFWNIFNLFEALGWSRSGDFTWEC